MDYRYIKTDYLEMVSGGNREITGELISIFRQQVQEFNEQMATLFKNGKYEEMGLLAHKAKSSVAIMGMEELASLLKEMETMARTGANSNTYSDTLIRFSNDTAEAVKELESYLSTL